MSTAESINQNKVLISVCIATYDREKLLEKLLLSLINQDLPSEIKLEIIVTDNSRQETAKTIVKKFPNNEKIIFKYLVQKQKNISLTRNESVANSCGDWICFIDDDETASEFWIINLYKTVINYKADGVFGFVEPIFGENVPDYLKRREFYFTPVGETGTKALFFYTTNAIIKAAIIKNEKTPFDPSYGLTGGEDVHLFERLALKGSLFVVCKEAVTYEYIPIERGSKKYLFNRALRGGQAFVRRRLELKNNMAVLGLIFIKVIISILIALIKLLVFPVSKKWELQGIIDLGASIGKLRGLFGNYKDIY